MDKADIAIRAKKMGASGIDMRTAICDVEDRLGRPMDAAEHMAFVDGWKKSSKDRIAKYNARSAADAREAFGR